MNPIEFIERSLFCTEEEAAKRLFILQKDENEDKTIIIPPTEIWGDYSFEYDEKKYQMDQGETPDYYYVFYNNKKIGFAIGPEAYSEVFDWIGDPIEYYEIIFFKDVDISKLGRSTLREINTEEYFV